MKCEDGNGIPAMTGADVREYIREIGRGWTGQGVAVECGAWMGASTVALAAGLKEGGYDRVLHAYDRWSANKSEVDKAAAAGVEIGLKENLRARFLANAGAVGVDVEAHACELVFVKWWEAEPIEVFLLDAAKWEPGFSAVLRAFGPYWLPGVTTVGLLDYHYWRQFPEGRRRTQLRCQEEFVERHAGAFTVLRDYGPKRAPCFFRYEGGVDWGMRHR